MPIVFTKSEMSEHEQGTTDHISRSNDTPELITICSSVLPLLTTYWQTAMKETQNLVGKIFAVLNLVLRGIIARKKVISELKSVTTLVYACKCPHLF
jgi:hypothetical protein